MRPFLSFPGLPLLLILAVVSLSFAAPELLAQSGNKEVTLRTSTNAPRPFVQLKEQDKVPTIRAIVPIDGANVFFLNHRGQIGMAKFSPGLSQIGWEFYSEVKLSALPGITLGPNYSVITASPSEVTQSFDTNQDVSLDFFQALVQDWPGRDAGVVITAGPVADPFGRILFALSPAPAKPGETPRARIAAYHPSAKGLVIVTESELRVDAFAVDRSGLLAARLHMPDYPEGYFLSLTSLPPFLPEQPDLAPDPMPVTLPSLVIPAELTQKSPPTQLCFFGENNREKILLTCPGSKQLIEITPEKSGGIWQGAILRRGVTATAVETLVEMSPGMILGGGDAGFVPLTGTDEPYRITRLALAKDGIVLDFNRPVNRLHAAQTSSYAIKALAATGSTELIVSDIVIESDGRTLVLKTGAIPAGTVLRVVCKSVASEDGETLLSPECFYTVYARAEG